jgi:hypothetical protein
MLSALSQREEPLPSDRASDLMLVGGDASQHQPPIAVKLNR